MTYDLILRTYVKDFDWLNYSIPSISRFSKGHRQLLVLCPWPQLKALQKVWRTTKIYPCPVYKNDYLGQQISKLQAWSMTDADILVYTDSDAIFIRPYSLNIIDGKIPRLITDYERLGDIAWRKIVTNNLGWEPQFEHMRRLPQAFWREDVRDCCQWLADKWGEQLAEHIIKEKSFSEFNIIGEWCYRFRNDKYIWNDTINGRPPDDVRQFWSWGGITPNIIDEIRKILKSGE